MNKARKMGDLLSSHRVGVNKEHFIGKMPQALLAVAAFGIAGVAGAVELSKPDSDLNIHFDNTVRYTIGQRVEKQDQKILNNAVSGADSDALFARGDVVTNRVDLLSELDVVYKGKMGFRVSGAAWFDKAYDTNPKNALGLPTNYNGDQFSSYTKRYYRGPSGEFLDAFVFGKFDAGSVPVNVKLGRHITYWGESVFSAHAGVNYGQAPVDLVKALNNPGSEVKELFMPMSQLSAQAQVTDTLSLAAYHGLEWRPDRFPEGGTYLMDAGFLFNGPDKFSAAGNIPRLQNLKGRDNADWGVSARWRPEWLDGVAGLYYRKFDEKDPWLQLGSTDAGTGFRQVFPKGTELYGVSLSKVIGGVSVGAELAYRKNTGLNSTNVDRVDNQGARGDTLNGLVNGVWYFGKNPLWNQAVFVGELTWNHLRRVTKHPELINAVGYASCVGKDKWDGCVTKNAVGATIAFTPSWDQVLPSLDVSMPMSIGVGLKGNGPTPGTTNQGQGSYSIGLTGIYQNKYTISLKYNDYLVRYKDNGVVSTAVNGGAASLISDRGWVSLTFKTSF